MATYNIPFTYQCIETITVEADSLEEAMVKSGKKFLSIPDDKYLSDTFEFDLADIEDKYPNEDFDVTKVFNQL